MSTEIGKLRGAMEMSTASSELEVRSALPEDAAQVAEIYNHYIRTSTITFEEEPVSASEMGARIRETQSQSYPWLVATNGTDILGYAYAGKWKVRAAYRHSSEITVYVRPGGERAGVGTALYRHLLPALKACGVHAAIGGVALPNDASIRLHEKFEFEKCAHFREVGFKFNRWIDVAYWERIL
jgi:L-amino acid N-acyltransferase YncA